MITTIEKMLSFEEKWYTAVFTWNHIDILQTIHQTIKDLYPLKIERHHVKGHAEEKEPKRQSTREEEVNQECDLEATIELEQQTIHKKNIPFMPLPETTCYLQHKNIFISNHEAQVLMNARPQKELEKYYKKRYQWNKKTLKSIDWESFAKATKNNNKIKRFIPKLCCKWLPTMTVLNKREDIPTQSNKRTRGVLNARLRDS